MRSIFAGDRCVAVSQGGNGLVRVYVGKVSRAILGTVLPVLRLTPYERYDPLLAIIAVEKTKGFGAALRRFGFRLPAAQADFLIHPVIMGSPCLPAVLREKTVDDVLDLIAHKFHGIVIYGQCRKAARGSRIIWIDFTCPFPPAAKLAPTRSARAKDGN